MNAIRPVHHSDREPPAHTALRWSLAGMCIFTFYGGGVYAALNWSPEAIVAAELPAAVMIELAPLPVAPDTPQQKVALGPQMEMSQATTPSEQEDRPDPAEAKPEIKTEIEIAPLPEQENAAAVLAPATPPQPDRPKDEKRKPDKPKKTSRKPQDRNARNSPATAAPKAANLQRAAINAAAMAGMSSSVSPATWRSMIMAHLNRHKRAPPGGGRGTSMVVFTIDRSGRVLSARLAGSSGDAALDQAAVAIMRRASPVPAPPPNIGGGVSILLTVPVRFGG
jgi:protein TonB